MKKVAVCISGQFRTFDKCLQSFFSNLILCNTQYELFFFASFAKQKDKIIDIPKEFQNIASIIKIEEDSLTPNLDYEKNKYVYRDYILDENDTKLIFHQLKQFKSVFQLVEEYENNNQMRFDYVMRLRTDLEIKNVFNWSLKEDRILIPNSDDYGGYNDRFAIGPRSLMETYMKRLDYWYSRSGEKDFTTHNEGNLKMYLDSNKIKVEVIPLELQYVRFNDFSQTKIKINNINENEVRFSNVSENTLLVKTKICCGTEVLYSTKIEIPSNVVWFVASEKKCKNKKVIFEGKDLYLEYKMN
jgi:hypothetical protein